MEQKGRLIAQVFTARQAIPIEGVSVSIMTDVAEGSDEQMRELLAFRKTDRSGKTEPVELPAPDVDLTLAPSQQQGFSVYDVRLDHPDYYSVLVENVQVFAGVESIQPMEMIPLEEYSDPSQRSRMYRITPQDL